MAGDGLRYLTALAKLLKPQHILEFGSGISTQVLARATEAYPEKCSITSVDHDPIFGKQVATKFSRKKKTSCRVNFQIAPITARPFGDQWLPAYLLTHSRFASSRLVDLVIIDGPPKVLGGREGVLYQAMDFSKPGTVVLLDDAARSDEQKIISNWKRNLGDAIDVIELPGFIRGMAAIIIRKPIHMSRLLKHRKKITQDEIKSHTSPKQTILVAGSDYWLKEIGRNYRTLPFIEARGKYMGAPPDDNFAIKELNRIRRKYATVLVIGWPEFWWLDYYKEWSEYLHANFPCLLKNERLVIFDLRCKHLETSS